MDSRSGLMGRSFMAWAFASLVMATVVSGCMSSRPFYEGADLIPLKPSGLSGSEGFCYLAGDRESPQLIVSVQNVGEGESPASLTSIDFFPGGSVQLHTPAIAGGDWIDLPPVAIPPACFNPDCEFSITVDWGNDINESGGEGNNEVAGRCLRS